MQEHHAAYNRDPDYRKDQVPANDGSNAGFDRLANDYFHLSAKFIISHSMGCVSLVLKDLGDTCVMPNAGSYDGVEDQPEDDHPVDENPYPLA
jgi:hypothetical protein